MPTRDDDIDALVEAVQVLARDVQMAAHLSQHQDSEFARRAYVRAAFALVEGNLNLMADLVLRSHHRGEVTLSQQDLEMLQQTRETTDEGGFTVVRVKFVPICDRIAPVFNLFARVFGKTFRTDKSTKSWRAFVDTVVIRNRITHPKNARSFEISGSDLNVVESAREWYAAAVEALLSECFSV